MSANQRFLEAMFQDALPGTHTIICGFPGDPYKADRRAWAGLPWRPGDAVPLAFARCNSYLTVSTFEPDPQTGEMRRRKANFSSMHAVMVDDVGTKVPKDKLLLAPSALIETSPRNYQAFHFLVQNEQSRDRELCERLVNRMVAAGLATDGKDPGMTGVTRFGRLPEGVNGKAKYVEQLGHAFQVRCVLFDPVIRYRVGEIAVAWNLDLAPEQRLERPRASVTPINIAETRDAFAALLKIFEALNMYRGRIGSGPWHEVTCPWIDAHTGRADSGAAIADPSEANNFAGGYRCHHGHCEDRTIADVWRWARAVAEVYAREQPA
jgi:hypothetical protein